MSSLEEQQATSGKAYWRSLDDLADTPEFREILDREFPSFAKEFDTPASRRSFLKLMGASMALAGMTACRWPTEEILPFATRPEGRAPGEPVQYATAMDLAGSAIGLLVTSYDGRPIKIEGNPLHPASLGATAMWSQAAVLELYDPDRGRTLVERHDGTETTRSWDEFRAAARAAIDPLPRGAGLYVLSEASSSPTFAAMKARLAQRWPEAVWLEYEPLTRDAARRGSELAFGRAARAHLALDRATTVVSFDDDFLLHHPAAVRYARDWARSRKPVDGSMSRLYVVEPRYGLTGSCADFRLAVAPSHVGAVLRRLAAELFGGRGLAAPRGAAGLAAAVSGAPALDERGEATVARMADDLMASRGASVVTVGPAQPPELHALAHALNEALGNVGATVTYSAEPDPGRPSHLDAIARLAAEAAGGKAKALFVLGGNPVYDAPADLDLAAAIAAVPFSARLGLYRDETAATCSWYLPRAHFLESWGDARAWDGTVSIAQPLIEPLWDGRTPVETLALLLDEPEQNGYALVRRTAAATLAGELDHGWRRAVHDGVVAGTAYPAIDVAVRGGDWTAGPEEPAPGAGGLELVLQPDNRLLDGRFANLGWLQELPDLLSKVTWDNAALLSPATAKGLGVTQGDVVKVTHDGREIELPVHLLPGQPAGTVGVALGFGRTRAGRVGDGVGVDAYRLRTSSMPWGGPCTVAPTGRAYELATTQDHFAIDTLALAETERRRPILVREGDIAEFDADPKFVEKREEIPEQIQLWKRFEYDGWKWGMAIDLNACIGCAACTVACQAENNIPVVGRDEVRRGREMHWIRVDRYFSGDAEAPAVSHQPVTCHHCENAPCESVCPVAATVHDAQGLNVMVYNRCIGTRYCSNNCPYKVRRFNWFNNHKHETAVGMMVYNPDVTVRSRGVMEKCTFCLQRIERHVIRAKNERRPIATDEFTTACAQVCPTEAISFGDLNNPENRVAKMQADPRAYTMLESINVRPRTRYLARLRNRGEAAASESGGHEES